MGGNFKFPVKDSFLEYFLGGRFEKLIAFSGKKPPLAAKLSDLAENFWKKFDQNSTSNVIQPQ